MSKAFTRIMMEEYINYIVRNTVPQFYIVLIGNAQVFRLFFLPGHSNLLIKGSGFMGICNSDLNFCSLDQCH